MEDWASDTNAVDAERSNKKQVARMFFIFFWPRVTVNGPPRLNVPCGIAYGAAALSRLFVPETRGLELS